MTSSVSVSIMMMNRNGLKADPWCSPTSIPNSSVSPQSVRTIVVTYLCMLPAPSLPFVLALLLSVGINKPPPLEPCHMLTRDPGMP